jgi:hypothetical protein
MPEIEAAPLFVTFKFPFELIAAAVKVAVLNVIVPELVPPVENSVSVDPLENAPLPNEEVPYLKAIDPPPPLSP